ncbi:helix-turn-helix transcriptional regulator [Streptomyces sp. NBC_00669]|uniref:helix-turn-helix domain-containing protein n=1 Tax=Streptomyces sp. NBC_00669 TaxID=2976011 RepID=UPI002E3334CC|nr:helix-turn-helix transcriptional regulator [Streptomyces sp. NBC_00669]
MYAEELARLRKLHGWTLVELGDRCNYEQSYLHRLETGGRLGTLEAAQALDRVYGTGHVAKLWLLAKEEAKRSRYGGFADVEADATSIQEFSISTVPGLLQTRAYAEELLRTTAPGSDKELAAGVDARISRQIILSGKRAIIYRGLLDESVLRRPTLSSSSWREQVESLIEAAQQPNITLQIVPFKAGLHRLINSSLQLLWLQRGQTVTYVESSWSGQLVEEFEDVEKLRLFYDRLRDSALSPSESLQQLHDTLEDTTSCVTSPQT